MQTLHFLLTDGIERRPFVEAVYSPDRTYVWLTFPEPVELDGELFDSIGYPVTHVLNMDELTIGEPNVIDAQGNDTSIPTGDRFDA